MNPIDDSTNRVPGWSFTELTSTSDGAVLPPADAGIPSSAVEDGVYTDEEEALVQERLKNLGYL